MTEHTKSLTDILEHIAQGVVMIDKTNKLVVWNKKYQQILQIPDGFLKPRLSGRDIILLLAKRGDYGPGDPHKLADERLSILWSDTRSPKTITVRNKRTYEVLTQPTGDGGLTITYTDITRRIRVDDELRQAHSQLEQRVEQRTGELRQEISERKHIEAELRKAKEKAEIQEELFTKVYQFSPALSTIASPKDGRHLDVNNAWSSITGYSRAEAFAKTSVQLGLWEFPEHRKKFVKEIKTKGYVRNFETVYRTKNGALINMLLAGDIVDFRGEDCILVVGQDISERIRMDRMKSEFIATVSHELRTPLTSINGALGLSLSGVLGKLPKKASNMIKIAHKNCERLINLVNDILDVEKLNSSQMVYTYERLALSELLTEAVIINEGYAVEHGVKIRLKIHSPAIVWGDAFRLNQVVANLFSNAAKFSPSGSDITISLDTDTGLAIVKVSDEGPGIPASFHTQVFDQFSQADASDARARGGTGLGLNICRSIVENHQGEIGFHDNSPCGTTFFIKLPLITVLEAGPRAPLHV